ncbi:hypothetical protein BU24DRAFT_177707 [Aaosphaeria arxii CBS 175.79]|uniref:Uncharacterized protein n=1 Tax=Aaosphaeria arxii CBS 175.79 TaxID=1450172 RepID=A0A6A5XRU3_9PLEO|nr:uncharacterized protein BU24DRAFT_177707 [Aaosphaeria arxii CBS 175.79]KAF2015410.1 hypothetical protein BU24DRAFT_177707 [Aaosphaeria arxii CBS 175.79]
MSICLVCGGGMGGWLAAESRQEPRIHVWRWVDSTAGTDGLAEISSTGQDALLTCVDIETSQRRMMLKVCKLRRRSVVAVASLLGRWVSFGSLSGSGTPPDVWISGLNATYGST